MDLRKVIGFPGYLMDVDDGTVWSYINGKRALKVSDRVNGTKVVNLCRDGKRHTVMYYRLWYACRHNIPISRIPADLHVTVVQPGNELRLCTKRDQWQDMMTKKNARLAATRDYVFRRRLYELLLMQNTYKTGDVTEMARYVETLREESVNRYVRKYNVRKDAASLLFDAASERLIESLKKPSSLVIDITGCMRGLMRKEAAKTKAVHLQEYLDVLRFPEQPIIKPTKQTVQL